MVRKGVLTFNHFAPWMKTHNQLACLNELNVKCMTYLQDVKVSVLQCYCSINTVKTGQGEQYTHTFKKIYKLSFVQRLSIAKEFGDKAAERRAYSNLGNALIFLGQFNTATEYYR